MEEIRRNENRNEQQDLNDLITYFDPLLKKAWEANADNKIRGMWSSTLIGPIYQLGTFLKLLEKKKFALLPFIYTGPVATIFAYAGWDSQAFIHYFGYEYANWMLMGICFIIWYILTSFFHLLDMAKIDSPHFHIGAFARLRKAEYEAFQHFIQGEQTFSFQSLKDWVYDPIRIGHVVEKEKELLQEKQRSIEIAESLQEALHELAESKNLEISGLENELDFTFRLLNKVKTNLFRFVNGQLTPYDLEFICPYTLYKLEGNTLVKIADVGTSGNGKNINITEHPNYSSVIVLSHAESFYYMALDKERVVFSYRMDMPDGSTWVMNFHIYETNEEIMEFFFGDGIIDTRTLFDLIHVHCQLLQLQLATPSPA